jgi:hypothetical protein
MYGIPVLLLSSIVTCSEGMVGSFDGIVQAPIDAIQIKMDKCAMRAGVSGVVL